MLYYAARNNRIRFVVSPPLRAFRMALYYLDISQKDEELQILRLNSAIRDPQAEISIFEGLI